MPRRDVHVTAGGASIYFDRGKIDDWCVYVQQSGQTTYAPRDLEYFSFLRSASERNGDAKFIYDMFCILYDLASQCISPAAGKLLRDISSEFGDSSVDAEIHLAVIYAAMIAEENKQYTALGKRIKRLGVHQLLLEGFSPAEAANWSRGKKAPALKEECKRRGF